MYPKSPYSQEGLPLRDGNEVYYRGRVGSAGWLFPMEKGTALDKIY
jgi:hypothetical protein